MDLRYRSSRERFSLETAKKLIGRLTKRRRENLKCLLRREWRHLVLELSQLVDNIRWE